MSTDADTVAQTHPFQAEVAELLRLMVNAVYSEADVFLRELISNASDACDRLRYEAIAKPELLAAGGALAIRIAPDAKAGTLTVATDTGAATLPLTATVCATNASTGACLAPPVASFPQSFQSNGAQTFSVFLSASAPISFAPATARVFLRFLDSSGVSHGSTSIAVETN